MVKLELCQGQRVYFALWQSDTLVPSAVLPEEVSLQHSKVLQLVPKTFIYLQVTKHFGEETVHTVQIIMHSIDISILQSQLCQGHKHLLANRSQIFYTHGQLQIAQKMC